MPFYEIKVVKGEAAHQFNIIKSVFNTKPENEKEFDDFTKSLSAELHALRLDKQHDVCLLFQIVAPVADLPGYVKTHMKEWMKKESATIQKSVRCSAIVLPPMLFGGLVATFLQAISKGSSRPSKYFKATDSGEKGPIHYFKTHKRNEEHFH